MPIKEISDAQLSEVLHKHLTPSKEIETPERLFGREQHLKQIRRAFNSEGRHIFIFGDRGVGKTSLAVTAAALNTSVNESDFSYIPCGENITFEDVMHAAANSVRPIKDRLETKSVSYSLNFGGGGLGIGGNASTGSASPLPRPKNVVEALDILREPLNNPPIMAC